MTRAELERENRALALQVKRLKEELERLRFAAALQDFVDERIAAALEQHREGEPA